MDSVLQKYSHVPALLPCITQKEFCSLSPDFKTHSSISPNVYRKLKKLNGHRAIWDHKIQGLTANVCLV